MSDINPNESSKEELEGQVDTLQAGVKKMTDTVMDLREGMEMAIEMCFDDEVDKEDIAEHLRAKLDQI